MITTKEANYLNALRRFEDAAFALLDAWVETGAGAYPFPDSFDEVCANLTTFRERVAIQLSDELPVDVGKALGCYGCAATFATGEELDAHELATGHGEGEDDPNSPARRRARGAL